MYHIRIPIRCLLIILAFIQRFSAKNILQCKRGTAFWPEVFGQLLNMDTSKAQRLYNQLIDAWNNRDALTFANCFTGNSICIGFDGSEMFGETEILSNLSKIFKDHPTARYVTIVREVRELPGDMALVRAHVGMIPSNKFSVEPGKNAVQVMIAGIDNGIEKIILFQNTPAQLHGRPEAQEKLTRELQQAADSKAHSG